MMRSLRHYHMGCGETLSSSGWLTLMQKATQAGQIDTANKLVLKKRKKKS